MTGLSSILSSVTVSFPNLGDDNIFTTGFKVDNVMFTIPGTDFNIYWYGALIAIGIIVAIVYCFRKAPSYGLNPDRVTDVVIGGLIGAVIGARLYYIVFSLDSYRNADGSLDIAAMFSIRDGGLAIYGGIIGALLVGCIVAKFRRCRIAPLLDLASHGFLIGQCIGRWGNFFNQEAFGTNTDLPWGMYSESTRKYLRYHLDEGSYSPTSPVHPCFLYESIWCLLGFILLHFLRKKRKFDGEIFLLYIGWYGLGRFFIEGLRTDSLYLFNIRVSQLVAGTCVLASIVLLLVFRSSSKRSGAALYVGSPDSVILLADYTARSQVRKERRELSKKLKAAKETGDGITDLTVEYEEKFGDMLKKKDYIDGVKAFIIENAIKQKEELEQQKEKELSEDKSKILDDDFDDEEDALESEAPDQADADNNAEETNSDDVADKEENDG